MTGTSGKQAAGESPPPSVIDQAIRYAQAGNWSDAIATLDVAIEASPNNLIAWLTMAGVKGRSGDTSGEFAAIQQVLSIDPYYVPALLLKGNWYEGHDNAVLAASSYTHALTVSPPEPHWPQQIRAELAHAQTYVAKHADGLRRHLDRELQDLRTGLDPAVASRWTEAISVRAGKSEPYVSNSNQLYVPRLAAIPFFEREQFPFLKLLESNTAVIRDELSTVLDTGVDAFQPYISYRPDEPVNQWAKLNRSRDWNALHLWRNGEPVTENLNRCPESAELLERIALCDLSGLCPNVFFSALAAGTHIPPHYGESNARVIAHLPLIVPNNCKLRVGFEEREWIVGETLIFDDTLEHEAWNNSEQLRVVLIFDLWNPQLSEPECRMASALAAATRDYRGT